MIKAHKRREKKDNNSAHQRNDFDKIHEIFDYLVVEFPDSSIGHHYDSRLRAETFLLKFKNRQVLISFSSQFLKDTAVDEMLAKLQSFNLADPIRQSEASHIIITSSGLEFENQE